MAFVSLPSSAQHLQRRALRPLRLWSALRERLALQRSRRQLAQLDADRLNDLGLTAHEARIEAQRPIWDAPRNWYL